jgi:membrane protease YdiL (CAAX protease family)
MGCQIALVCMVPLALRLNSELGLPGAPFIAAKLARQRPPGRLRSLIKIALLYGLAAIGASTLAFAGLKLSGVIGSSAAKPGAPMGSPLSFNSNPFAPVAAHPASFAAMGAMAAIGAGVSEEIMFRLSLFAISTWLFRSLLQDGTNRPGRSVLWCATIMQGYAFGLLHVILRPTVLPKIRAPILIAGLVVPQTWDGIILGRLYLRRGLEASMIAHAMIDLAATLLVAVVMYLVGLLSSMPHSGVSI